MSASLDRQPVLDVSVAALSGHYDRALGWCGQVTNKGITKVSGAARHGKHIQIARLSCAMTIVL